MHTRIASDSMELEACEDCRNVIKCLRKGITSAQVQRLVTPVKGVAWMTYNEIFTLIIMLIAFADLIVSICKKK